MEPGWALVITLVVLILAEVGMISYLDNRNNRINKNKTKKPIRIDIPVSDDEME